jgi:hypothetical protein
MLNLGSDTIGRFQGRAAALRFKGRLQAKYERSSDSALMCVRKHCELLSWYMTL